MKKIARVIALLFAAWFIAPALAEDISFVDSRGPLPQYPYDQDVLQGRITSWWQDVNNAVYRNGIRLDTFPGADPTCVADSTSAINAAISRAVLKNTAIYVQGCFRYTSTIVVPAKIHFNGIGGTSDKTPSGRGRSVFLKNFNPSGTGTSVAGFLFQGDDSGVDQIQFDNVAGGTGDNVAVWGSRWDTGLITVTNAGNDGLRLGKTDSGAATINANAFRIERVVALGNGRDGVNIDDTNTTTSVAYPLGIPNANGGWIGHMVLGSTGQGNARNGVTFGNSIDNAVGYLVAQVNTVYGARFTNGSRNHVILKAYTELNGTGEGILDAGATQNWVIASRYNTVVSGWTNSGGNSNMIITHESGVSGTTIYDAPWLFGAEVYSRAIGANTSYLGSWVTINQLPARIRTDLDSASGTRMTFTTRVSGVGESDKVDIDNTGNLSVKTVGVGLRVKEGANAKQFLTGAMVAGTLVVGNTSVTASSRILCTRQDGGANPGAVYVSARVVGTSFTVTSTNAADTGAAACEIFEPAP